jgi:nicotinamide riboside kinase
MRIVFTGSGGTGKSTLLKEVNKKLQYPVIHEGIREWLASNGFGDFKEMNINDIIEMQSDVMNGKIKQEVGQTNFISDRCTIDNLCYTLRWVGSVDSDHNDFMEQYISDAMAHAKDNYDIIFILPFGSFDIENDGTRSNKKYYQYMLQSLIEYHCYSLMTSGLSDVVIHKIKAVSLPERIAECMLVMNDVDLKRRGIIKGDGN